MFGPNIAKSGLSLTKVLSGISKGLGLMNQAIPIYKEIKPMIGNAQKLMSLAKEFSNTSPKTIDVTPKKEVEKTTPLKDKTINTTNPVFFL